MSSLQGKGAKPSVGSPEKSNTGQETSKTSPEPKVSHGTKRPAGLGGTKGDRGGKKAKRKEMKKEDDEEEEEEKAITSGGQRPKNSKRRSIASKVSYKEESNSEREMEDEGLSDEDEFQASSEEDSVDSECGAKSTKNKKGKGKSKAKGTNSKNTTAPKRRSGGGKKQVKEEDQEWEEEEEEDEEREGTTNNGMKRRGGRKKREGPGADEWLEVFLEKTSSWICVDVEHGVGVPNLCSQNATAPVTYVVSVDGDGFVKDLGRKYDPTWMTSSKKRRVDEDWWEETLEPFLGPEDERDMKEDKEVRQTNPEIYVLHIYNLQLLQELKHAKKGFILYFNLRYIF